MEVQLSEISPENNTQVIPDVPAAGRGWKGLVQEVVETLGLAVLLFLVINIISARVRVDGFSMRPTLNDGEFVRYYRFSSAHVPGSQLFPASAGAAQYKR